MEAATAVRASTGELWAELRPRLAEAGLLTEGGQNTLGRRGWEIVNELRSSAVARRTGYERFQRAPQEQVFTADMAAPDLSIRSPGARFAQPEYLARFDMTYITPSGDSETRTVSVRQIWRDGMTVSDVWDDVQEAAEGLSLEYGQALAGISNIRPVMV